MSDHRLLVGGELLLYGSVGDVWGDESGFTAREVVEALAVQGGGDLTVRINSGGGLVADGVAICNALSAHRGAVTILVDGIAASSASLIAMAGNTRVMRAGSLMMIHEPTGVTMGDADDHLRGASQLDQWGDRAAAIYASATGATVEDIRALMRAETWMNESEALAFGFATETSDESAIAASMFDYAAYSATPEALFGAQRMRAQNLEAVMATKQEVADAAATPTSEKGPQMAVEESAADVAVQTPEVAEAKQPELVVDQTRDILSRCTAAKLSLDQTNIIVQQAEGNLDRAKDLIIEAMASIDPEPGHTTLPARVVADARDRFALGAEKAILGKAGMPGGERNEFTGMTLRELARESIVATGSKADFADPMQMVAAALGAPTRVVGDTLGGAARMSGGQHTTSDFVHILANVAYKSMLKGYEEAGETFQQWTATGSLVDFKPTKRVDLNLFPSLNEVPEGAEYNYGTIGDRGEEIQLATYGRMFSITRHAIINDDLSVMTRVPMRMGRAAIRTVGNLVYAILTSNPAMSDSVALFHADHGNLASSGAAPSVATVDAAIASMATQTDPDGHSSGLNISPRWFIVPMALRGTARTLMASEFDPGKTQRTPNHVRETAEVIADARLDAASSKAWYMAGDANAHDTIEVAYLNGVQTPMLEQREGWAVDGVEFKVRIDAGVKALDFRALYKNAGE